MTISKLCVHQLTGFLNFSSNEDWLYFPSLHNLLVMTIVMLITFPPMSVKYEKDHYYKMYLTVLMIQVLHLKTMLL